VTIPTASQLNRLRTRPHRTKLWLGIFNPETVLSAQINQADISKGEREIQVDLINYPNLYLPFDGSTLDAAYGASPTIENGGIIYDKDSIGGMAHKGYAIQLAEATTNQFKNPSFENNIVDNWTQYQNGAGGAWAQSNEWAKVGIYSVKITAGDGDRTSVYDGNLGANLDDGETITVSVWSYCVLAGKVNIKIYDQTNSAWRVQQVGEGNAGEDTLHVATWENDTGGAVSIRVYLENNAADSSTVVYFDAVQAEIKDHPTPYCDGSLGTGHSWSGAAHNSTSSRTEARLEYDIGAGSLSSWTVAFRITPLRDSWKDGESDWNRIFEIGPSGDYFAVWARSGSEQLTYAYINSGGSNYYKDITTDAPTGGAKYHVAVTYDAATNTMTWYFQGVLVGTQVTDGDLTPGDDMLYLGNAPEPQDRRSNLWLDEFIIFDHALDEVEVGVLAEHDADALIDDPNDVVNGMTVYIGTSQGGHDVGRLRVRSADATSLTVAENSLLWQDDWYMTVVRYFEPWTVFPRIVLDDDNVPTFYKDYDIAYTDQNQILDPVICMGPHHAGFLEYQGGTGTAQVWYTSSGTFDPTPGAANITGGLFEWNFGEAGFVYPTGSNLQHPGYIEYHSGGYYTTELTVTTPAGNEFTGYRHIMIFDRPDRGPERPFIKWGIESLAGSREEGGYDASLWIREEAGYGKVVDGALVVIFSDDWQGTAEGAIGGNAENRESIFFVGYIDDGSINLDPQTNRLNFTASSVTKTMRIISNYSASLESKTNAMTWYQLREMNVDRALIHLLRWHSTVLAVADFSPTSDTKPLKYADFNRGSLYESASGFLESALGAQMVSDRQGKIWCEIAHNLQPTGTSRNVPTALDISRTDWRGELVIQHEPSARVGYMEAGGVAYSGPVSGTVGAFLAGAPGEAAGYRGNVDRITGLVLESQAQLNALIGNMYAYRNAIYPSVELPMAGDYRTLDLAPQERITLTLEKSDTWRQIIWSAKEFVLEEINYEYRPAEQVLFMDVNLHEETHGDPGIEIEIPEDPPYDTPWLPDWDIEFPPILPFEPWVPPVEPPPSTGDIVYVAEGAHLGRSRNFNTGYPNWEPAMGNVSGSSWQAFHLDPFDPKGSAMAILSDGVYRCTNLNSTSPVWFEVLSKADAILLSTGDPTDDLEWEWLEPVKKGAGKWAVLVTCDSGGPDDLRLLLTEDYGANWTMKKVDGATNQAEQSPLVLHEWGDFFGLMFVGGRQTNTKGLLRSLDGGSSWASVLANRDILGIHVPYPQNAGMYIVYVADTVNRDNGNKRVLLSADQGLNFIDITPEYDGKRWGQNVRSGQRFAARQMVTYSKNRYLMYALFQPKSSVSSVYNGETVLFRRPTTYGEWVPMHHFNGLLLALHINENNPDKLYCLGDKTAVSTPSAYIAASDDAGVSWADKLGDWETVFGSIASNDFNPITIRPVWSE
jgi:hypothetical protein